MNEKQPPISTNRISLRDIAQELEVSHVTVSKALRNLSGVSEKLKLRIREKADEMGYIPDPMLASLSRYRSTSKSGPIHSEIAWFNPFPKPDSPRQYKEFDLYWEGACDTAKRLGFRVHIFNIFETPKQRLKTILETRNIKGILIPPLHPSTGDSTKLENFDWSTFATVRFGKSATPPQTHLVSSSQISNTIRALDNIHQLGYSRVGFVGEYRANRFFEAGYYWAQKELPPKYQVPPLSLNPNNSFEQQQHTFKKWLNTNTPDAILTDNSETLQMLKNLKYRIPQDIGLATTSIHDTKIDTGIDQNPYEIGRAAIRLLTALIAEQSFGIPEFRNETLIEGKWAHGSMLPDLKNLKA